MSTRKTTTKTAGRKNQLKSPLRLAAKKSQTIPVLAALAVVIAGVIFASRSLAATSYTTSQWDTALDKVIHADDTQSVMLPSGKTLWTFGDTIQVNGVTTTGSFGYPHDAFVTQSPGTLSLTPVKGSYGYGWQQVPNWSDGSYFWMSTPVVDKGVLYVLGMRVKGGSDFTTVGSYVAVFNAGTLAFQKIVAIPDGSTGQTVWGGIAKGSGGWWVGGTHAVACTGATDCKVGDFAWVPSGDLATAGKWQVHNNVIPATANVGTTLGLVSKTGGWDIFTKTGDAYGGNTIERLTAGSVTGPWSVNGSWSAPNPTGTVSYGVAVHPEQAAASNQVLVSYNINDFHSICWPLFEYLPK